MVPIFLWRPNRSRRLGIPYAALGSLGSDIEKPVRQGPETLGCGLSAKGNDPPFDRLSVLVLPAVEERITLCLGHFQDSAGFTFMLPLFRLGVDRLSGKLGNRGSLARVRVHAVCSPREMDEELINQTKRPGC